MKQTPTDSQQQFLNEIGRDISDCACTTCKTLCKISPCFGTPEDIQAILDDSPHYKDILKLTTYLNPNTLDTFDVVAPLFSETHGCIMQHGTGGPCVLHDRNLKPIEGKVAHHSDLGDGINLRESICDTWDSELGQKLLKRFGS